MTSSNQPNILIFDIETVLLHFRAFSPGEQYLGHKQLVPGKSRHGMICITYKWFKGPTKIIKWTPEGGQEAMIREFDAIASQADVIIGKNSDKFDVKMINGMRIFTDLPGAPAWALSSDDLEKQMRKYFRLPSMSLDYISNQLGLGGKIKMEFSDWVAIDDYMTIEELRVKGMSLEPLSIYCDYMFRKSYTDVLTEGLKAFKKMCFYGKKDTDDTETLWEYLSKHFDSKFNYNKYNKSAKMDDPIPKNLLCKHVDCGSSDLRRTNNRMRNTYVCNNCGRYAGCTTSSLLTGKEGGMR